MEPHPTMASVLQGILVVVLLLLPASTFASKFWYIDCGSSKGFVDSSNITWTGDDQFVRSGKSVKASQYGTTLRVFPKNQRNCYTIPVGEGNKIFARVGFAYDNYDGKFNAPVFVLMFDTTLMATIRLPDYGFITFTAIYMARKNDTYICVARVFDDQDPLVSFIMISVLGPGMYPLVESGFILYSKYYYRYVFGSTDGIRYPDDNYDRVWYQPGSYVKITPNYVALTSNSTVAVNTTIDDPPAKLFSTAIAPAQRATNNLTIAIKDFFGIYSRPIVYLSMYFTEISSPQTTTPSTRSFHIYMDDKMISNESNPIRPVFGEALEFTAYYLQVMENTTFTLVATDDSILPPTISGMEALLIAQFSLEATDSRDVNGTAILQENFDALKNWTGDPCLPMYYSWEWINCSMDNSPRITSLSLGGFGLSGTLPDFSTLDALETIDMHNNHLIGRIPEFLAELPELQSLNLAYNNFSSIPPSLINNTRIRLNITGNPLLDKSSPPSPPTPINELPSPPRQTGMNEPPPPPKTSMNEPPPPPSTMNKPPEPPSQTTMNEPPPPPKNGCKGAYGSAFSLHMLMLAIVIMF